MHRCHGLRLMEVLPANINSNYVLAGELGGGNKAMYNGSDSSVVIGGLQTNVQYYFASYEYNTGYGNSQNYLSIPGEGTITTLAVPNFQAAPESIAFGIAAVHADTIFRSYSLAGNYLENLNDSVTVIAPDGFRVSLDRLSGYTQTLKIPYTQGTIDATTIYACFVPATVENYSGVISHIGGGAPVLNIPVTGKGVTALIDTIYPVGFATLNGGTTGGENGSKIIITSAEQLAASLKEREGRSTTPIVYYISGQLSGYTTEITVKRTGNVSILGLGYNAEFLGFGIKIVECQNVVVRNIKFSDCKVDEKDGMSVDASSNVWVDHCSFSDSPSIDVKASNHDGALDIKNGSYNVTVSYNHLSNHRKTCLLGAGPGQTGDTIMKVTYYRNWFDGTYSRHPRVRFAKAHIINNYYSNIGTVPDGGGYGIAATCYSHILAEGNYFENTNKPVLISSVNDEAGTTDSDPAGYIKSLNNLSVSSGTIIENLGGYNFDPHDYYSYTPAAAVNVKNIVIENAGAGLLNIATGIDEAAPVIKNEFQLMQNFPNPFNPVTQIQYVIPANTSARGKIKVSMSVFDIIGNEVAVLVNEEQVAGYHTVAFNASSLATGVYFARLFTGGTIKTLKMILLK